MSAGAGDTAKDRSQPGFASACPPTLHSVLPGLRLGKRPDINGASMIQSRSGLDPTQLGKLFNIFNC